MKKKKRKRIIRKQLYKNLPIRSECGGRVQQSDSMAKSSPSKPDFATCIEKQQ